MVIVSSTIPLEMRPDRFLSKDDAPYEEDEGGFYSRNGRSYQDKSRFWKVF